MARHETSAARIFTVDASFQRLENLTLEQDELFREALRAAEVGLYRASHVLAWAGFIDFVHLRLATGYSAALATEYKAWKIAAAEDFRELSDFQVIEAGRKVGAYGKTVMKALHGLLNKRNECAHPSDFFPDLNGALGYLSEIFGRMEWLNARGGARDGTGH